MLLYTSYIVVSDTLTRTQNIGILTMQRKCSTFLYYVMMVL
jgi:hypothetical protein